MVITPSFVRTLAPGEEGKYTFFLPPLKGGNSRKFSNLGFRVPAGNLGIPIVLGLRALILAYATFIVSIGFPIDFKIFQFWENPIF